MSEQQTTKPIIVSVNEARNPSGASEWSPRPAQEKCKRMVKLIDELGLLCGHDPSSDVIRFDYQGHHYRIEEVEE